MDNFALDRAQALIDAGRHQDGLNQLSAHLAQNPDDARALCLASRALLGLGRNSDARQSASRAVTLSPDDDWPLRLVALANAKLGRTHEAVLAAEQAVRINPSSWLAHHNVAVIRQMTSRVTHHAADAVAEAARLAPNEPAVHRLAGGIHAELGHPREAQKAFRRALALDPSDAVARHELARVSFGRGNLASAADGFSNAARLDPRLESSARNLDVVVARALRWAFWPTMVATIAETGIQPRIAVATALTLAYALGLVWFWRGSGRQLRRYFAVLPRREPLLVTFAAMLALAGLTLWVEAALPSLSPAPFWVIGMVALLIGGIAFRRWVHGRRRDARRAPG